MPYERVDYTTSEGKQSAAYYDAKSQNAWNVFTREPVALTQDPATNRYSEWVPTPASAHVANQATRSPRERALPVVVRPIVTPLMIVPAALFGLGMIWLELTLGLK